LLQNNQKKEIDWDINQDFEIDDTISSIEGSRVFHQKYGYGTINSIDGDRAIVDFDKSDSKKIFIKYLQFKL
jgi:transcription elongation factor GreA-like protein